MTLHRLKIFETVARHLNITRASKELRISQPSVSKQLKSLQEFYAVKLFKKVGRSIELTNEGRLFEEETREILFRLERLSLRYGSFNSDSNTSSLIVGGSHGLSAKLLPSLLAAYKQSHPRVDVTLRTENSRGVERLILDSEIEIGVITNVYTPTNLCVELCRKEKLVPFVSARHPLAKKKALSLKELAQLPLIIKKKTGAKTSQVLKQIEEQGFKLNILMECESAEAVKLAAMNNLGVGLLYQDHIASETRNGELRIVKIHGLNEVRVNSYLVYRKDTTLSPYANNFRNFLLHQTKRPQDVISAAFERL